tara:strand:- start:12024 stop:12803 length:780 start_codon:yes stop_codon:yes gene_type:complete
MSTWLELRYDHGFTSVFDTQTTPAVSAILAFDQNHYPGAVNTILSLSKNTAAMLYFYVFSPDITESQKAKIRSLGIRAKFFKPKASKSDKYVWWFDAFTKSSIHSADYMMYIDADVIVHTDVDRWLSEFRASEALISGVEQKAKSKVWYETTDPSFGGVNTGVLLFKSEFFKTKEFQKLRKQISEASRIPDDQPFLRQFFVENKINVLYAPYIYNSNANYHRSGNAIFHFVGSKKPWNGKTGPEKKFYDSLVKKYNSGP